ncbi:MAG: hypothetical protein HKN73_14525 [Gemmatimonadetes bacterium]|nr:hypothetical protein [Gemmatimonadota bacterium]
MSPDAPSGVRLSQEQIRIVEFAIKEAIMEEVDGKLASAGSGGEEVGELLARLDAVERQAAERPAPVTISKTPSPAFLGGAAAAVVALAAATVLLLVPGRVDSAVGARSEAVATMAGEVETAHASLTANADRSDSLTSLIEARARELELTAGSAAFRSEIAQMLKNDSEFLRLSAGPPGPAGPTGTPPAGVRYAPGAAFFESGGVALASLGRSSRGGGHAQVHNQSGGRVGFLGASPSGDGLLYVNNGAEQATADIRTGADSSALTLQNGSALAYLATPNRGTAQLTVANRNGDGGVTLRSRDGLGAILVNGRTAHDLAEVFDLAVRDGVEPGTVMSVVDEKGLGPSTAAYDRRVVGVVSGAGGYVPGLVLGTRDDGSSDLPVAINGQVYVKADLAGGEIEPGDLLVAAAVPGRAMRGNDPARLTGAVIGKALEPFLAGDADGLVKMLVMTR